MSDSTFDGLRPQGNAAPLLALAGFRARPQAGGPQSPLLLLGFDVVVFSTGPIGPEFDEFVVEVHTNPAAHADDHRLAVRRFQSPLEVLDQVFGDQANPLLAADECFQRGPLGFELLLAILFFSFRDFLELGIDLGQFGFVQAQLGERSLYRCDDQFDERRAGARHANADVAAPSLRDGHVIGAGLCFGGHLHGDFHEAVFDRQGLRRHQGAGNTVRGEVHDYRHRLHVARAVDFNLDGPAASRVEREFRCDGIDPRALRFRDSGASDGAGSEIAGVAGVEERQRDSFAFDLGCRCVFRSRSADDAEWDARSRLSIGGGGESDEDFGLVGGEGADAFDSERRRRATGPTSGKALDRDFDIVIKVYKAVDADQHGGR